MISERCGRRFRSAKLVTLAAGVTGAAAGLLALPIDAATNASSCIGRICKWDVRVAHSLDYKTENVDGHERYIATFKKVPVEIRKEYPGAVTQISTGTRTGGGEALEIYTRAPASSVQAKGSVVAELWGTAQAPEAICSLTRRSYRSAGTFTIAGEVIAKQHTLPDSSTNGPFGIVSLDAHAVNYGDFPPVSPACARLTVGTSSDTNVDGVLRRVLVERGVTVTMFFKRRQTDARLSFPISRLAAGKRFTLEMRWVDTGPQAPRKTVAVKITFVRRA